MDLGTALTFITQDEDWIKKILIGALLVFTGIGFIVVFGWMVELIGRVQRGDPQPLPDWDDFGGLAVKGLKVLLIRFVWYLPLILLTSCLGAAVFLLGDSSLGRGEVFAIAGLFLGCLFVPYALLVSLLIPPMLGHFAAHDDLGAAINPATAFKLLRGNFGGFLVAWLIGLVAISILPSVGTVVCLVGVFPATIFAIAFQSHIYGQVYRGAMAVDPL